MQRLTCTRACPAKARARGVMLLALLLTMLLGAIAAMGAVQVWATTRQHDQELELLFVGAQYRQAIRHYYFSAPVGQPRVLPSRLEDLLGDDRFPVPVRHLRRLYPDPVTTSGEWDLVMQGSRIAGVRSRSQAQPLKRSSFDNANASFEGKSSYEDWAFVFVSPRSAKR